MNDYDKLGFACSSSLSHCELGRIERMLVLQQAKFKCITAVHMFSRKKSECGSAGSAFQSSLLTRPQQSVNFRSRNRSQNLLAAIWASKHTSQKNHNALTVQWLPAPSPAALSTLTAARVCLATSQGGSLKGTLTGTHGTSSCSEPAHCWLVYCLERAGAAGWIQ